MGESVLFLDGPLAGQTREVPTYRGADPSDTFYVRESPPPTYWSDPHDKLVDPPTITYRLKPNRLPHGPKWAYAVGDKVGEQIVSINSYTRECLDQVVVDGLIEHNANEGMRRIAAEVGLVAVEVHEVWRGTRREARETVMRNPESFGAAHTLVSTDSLIGDPGDEGLLDRVVWVVHEGVAMPAAAPT